MQTGTNGLSIRTSDGGHAELLSRHVRELQDGLAGSLLWPGHPEYEGARRVWNGLVDKHPGLVARCATESDVEAVVRFAGRYALELAVRGGGHNVAGRALSDGGLVVDLSDMRGVRIGADGGTVTADGGATIGDVDAATLPAGRVTPLGVVPATGIGGFTLHGGYGWLSRRFGLAVDNLVAARVVTAEGTVRTASAEENEDLFWALRGGGGNFGVVTSFSYRLHPIGPAVWFAVVIHPIDDAEAVLQAYRDFVIRAPDEISAIAVCWSAPEIPEVPASAHGAPVVILAAVHCGGLEQGEKDLGPLRAIGRPLADLSSPAPFAQVQRFFEPDYPNGRRYYWKSTYLPDLPDALVAAAIQRTRERPSPLSSIDFWGLGKGAISRVPVEATAFAMRDAPFLFAVEANWDDPRADGENIEWARKVHGDGVKHSNGQTYLNFPGFAEEGEALVRGAYGPNYERLRRIKARFDPDNVFRGNFNIAP
jgi:FAD/FMN-containing dehydrogenase